MVGAERFELPTLCSQSRCATRLRYAPTLPMISSQRQPGAFKECNNEPAEPEQQQERQHGEGDEAEGEEAHEEPVAGGVAAADGEALFQQVIVAAVRAPADVEEIAEDGDEADDDFDGEVGDHARDGDEGDAAEGRRRAR